MKQILFLIISVISFICFDSCSLITYTVVVRDQNNVVVDSIPCITCTEQVLVKQLSNNYIYADISNKVIAKKYPDSYMITVYKSKFNSLSSNNNIRYIYEFDGYLYGFSKKLTDSNGNTYKKYFKKNMYTKEITEITKDDFNVIADAIDKK